MGFSLSKLDPTNKNSAVRKSLRKVDSAVGGGTGWAQVGVIAGSVAAAPFTGGSSLAIAAGGAAKFATSRIAEEKAKDQSKKAEQLISNARAAESSPPPGQTQIDLNKAQPFRAAAGLGGIPAPVLIGGAVALAAVLFFALRK